MRAGARGAGLLLGALVVFTPWPAAAERLPIRAYTTSEGLAGDWVKRIVRDSRGFLWMCTGGGLSRFDGERFRSWGTADGMPTPSVNDALQARDGTLWIASNGAGLYRLQPKQAPAGGQLFAPVQVGGDPASNRVNSLLQDRSGTVWLGTDAGLFRLEGTSERPQPRAIPLGLAGVADGIHVRNIVEDAEGSLWIASGSGLLRRLPAGGFSRISPAGAPAPLIQAVAVDAAGLVWAADRDGVWAFRPGPSGSIAIRQASAAFPGALPREPGEGVRWAGGDDGLLQGVLALLAARDGTLWLASGRGMLAFDGKSFHTAVRFDIEKAGGAFAWLVGLAEDDEGNVWLGTEHKGALRLARGAYAAYGAEDGLRNTRVGRLQEDASGTLHAFTYGAFVHRLQGSGFSATPIPGADPTACCPLLDRSGGLWVGGERGLLQFTPGMAGATPAMKDGFGSRGAVRLFEDSRGDVWIGAGPRDPRVVTRWERRSGRFLVYSAADGLLAGWPTAFAEDRGGRVWIGFREGGVARRHGGGFEFFAKDTGLVAGAIYDLFLDSRGRLWVSSDRGISRCDEPASERPRFVTLPARIAPVTAFVEDREARLYVATGHGVYRLGDDGRALARYGVDEGLPANNVFSAFRDRSGALWFGTVNGLWRFVPGPEARRPPPAVYISEVELGGVRVPVSELGESQLQGLELQPGQRTLRIDFLGVTLRLGRILRFQYQLEGADADWGPPSESRSVTYAGLGPGRYRFRVRALTPESGPSLQPASVSFVVHPPFWRRAWFLVALGAGIALGAVALHRRRVARVLAVERMRVRIAGDLHDDIGSNLSQIAIMSEVARRQVDGAAPAAAEPLERIGGLARESIDSMGDIVWAVDPGKDRLGSLVHRMRRLASERLAAAELELRFTAPPAEDLPIGAETRRQAFLAFKEMLSNAIRHARCRRVTVELVQSDGRLELHVGDDGRGFDPQAAHTGHGLQSLRRRALSLGGALRIASQEGQGTKLTLEIPLRRG
jgi:signal transduction histidine kinase/ligand-binding sensor domain-containing protein